MTGKKTQEELEQPAKMYQLAAIEAQVKGLGATVQTGFNAVNENIKVLLDKSATQVTPQQLNDNIAALDKKNGDALDEAVEKIHLTYSPLKTKINTLNGVLATAVVLQLVYIAFNIFGGK